MVYLSRHNNITDVGLSDDGSVSGFDSDLSLDLLLKSDEENPDASRFVLTSTPPPARNGQARWYPELKGLRRVEFIPSKLPIDGAWNVLRPYGSSLAIFSLLTILVSLEWLNADEIQQLMTELSHHEVTVRIGKMCGDNCKVPILQYQEFRLSGDAAYVLSVEKQYASLDEVNELIATNPCKIIPQLQTCRERSRYFPSFLDEDRVLSLAAQVVLSTKNQIRSTPMRDLSAVIDLIARNLHSHVEHLDFVRRRKLDGSQLRHIARDQARQVRLAIAHQASSSLQANHITREAYVRMLAIGETLVPAVLYQVGSQLQNSDSRTNTLLKDVFGLAIGAALAAVPYGASASGWVRDFSAAVIDNLQPVRNTVGSMDLAFKRRRYEIKRHATQLSGLPGERHQRKAQELKWYADEMKQTWSILELRRDDVAADVNAARFAERRDAADRRRNKSVVDLVKSLCGRGSRE